MNRILKNIVCHAPFLLSDRKCLELLFEMNLGRRPDLDNPRSFNEKIQWLKLNEHDPRMREMVDKATAKEYAARIIGKQHTIPTIGIYDRARDIPWDTLPEQFVLKCTHDSGTMIICRDKATFDRRKAAKALDRGLARRFYSRSREWAYKGVKPRIICEPYMGEIADYKFFCFDGQPAFMFIATDRARKDVKTKFDFFDMDFRHLDFTNGYPNAATPPAKPGSWERMKEMASALSRGLRHVRVDLYEIDGEIYFGEMTFYHWGGLMPFTPGEWDYKLGEYFRI